MNRCGVHASNGVLTFVKISCVTTSESSQWQAMFILSARISKFIKEAAIHIVKLTVPLDQDSRLTE
jgi:hypothetical protein